MFELFNQRTFDTIHRLRFSCLHVKFSDKLSPLLLLEQVTFFMKEVVVAVTGCILFDVNTASSACRIFYILFTWFVMLDA